MLLSDRTIDELCLPWQSSTILPMIEPYVSFWPYKDEHCPAGVVSYGLTSAGYDARLCPKRVLVFKNTRGLMVNPKRFQEEGYRDAVFDVVEDLRVGQEVIIPPNGYVLGQTLEYIRMPRKVAGRCIGKSTLARSGILINTTPLEPEWCTSEDTEALTKDGWKSVASLSVGEDILTRGEDGTAWFRPVEKKHERKYVGDMLWFRGRSVDQLVTPDHKLFVHNRYEDGPRLVPASGVFGRWNYDFDRSVVRPTVSPATVQVAGRDYDALGFSEFYGCWLGDGSAYHGNDGGYHIKLAVVTKDKKRRLFRSVLRQLGIEAREEERGFHWYDKDLCLWLMRHGHAKDKYVDQQFLDMGRPIAAKLLSGLIASDGNEQTQTFTTASKRLADDAQVLAYFSGAAAIVREVETERWGDTFKVYKVRVCDDTLTPKMPPRNHEVLPYSGYVHCVTVGGHVWFMRRNGKASWTGNCGHLTLEIANLTPSYAVVFAGEGICQIQFEMLDRDPIASYQDKKGRYQGQTEVTVAKVL